MLTLAETARQRHHRLHPEKGAEYTAKWKYGITAVEYDRLFLEQGGVCAICRRPETRLDRMGNVRSRLSIDHDHETDIVRGLLCADCNSALDLADDSPARLQAMAAYLEASQC